MPYRLTAAAEQDIAGILRQTAQMFGPAQRARYAELLERAADLVPWSRGVPARVDATTSDMAYARSMPNWLRADAGQHRTFSII